MTDPSNNAVIVCDTWSTDVHPSLKARFPLAKFVPIGRPFNDHPHGHMVTDSFLERLGPDVPVTIYLYAYLSLQRLEPKRWFHILPDIPTRICSFGAEERGDRVVPRDLNSRGKMVFFATGNSDRSQRGQPDLLSDMNEPQRSLVHNPGIMAIGSCDPDGRPSTFSSEGAQVAYQGGRVKVFNPLTERFEYVSGTSFCAPKAAADSIKFNITSETEMMSFWKSRATVSPGWPRGTTHPKFGVGFMDDATPLTELMLPHTYHDTTRCS